MTSIWSFLLQTLTVSLAAALLLVVKYLLKDHLSPRWQYGIWGLLALRLLLPVAVTGRYVLLPLPLWVETVKSLVESGLSSTFSAPYLPLDLTHVFPYLTGRPVSVTDWLFFLYVLGFLAVLLYYAYRYVHLRALLRRGNPVSPAIQAQLDRVSAQYALNVCPAVTVPGLSSAFICGVFRPVLALPEGEPVDGKILLHELLHLQSRDAAQSVFWCFFRALHWCNPFLLAVFHRIGNDMESLCDQRVLERLEGEDRRAYGGILLNMANEKYPRAPGTTSVSNGGANISRRIAAIVRFKQYPQGMALVSLCIAVILASSLLWGTSTGELTPQNDAFSSPSGAPDLTPREVQTALAKSRITPQPTTPAGALDTYAKAILEQDLFFYAVASPRSMQEDLLLAGSDWLAQMVGGALDGDLPDPFWYPAFEIYHYRKQEDGSYAALLAFPRMAVDGAGAYVPKYYLLPVSIAQDNGWTVRPLANLTRLDDDPVNGWGTPDGLGRFCIPATYTYVGEGETGSVTVQVRVSYLLNQKSYPAESYDSWFLTRGFESAPNPDNRFTHQVISAKGVYTAHAPQQVAQAGLCVAALQDGAAPAFTPPIYNEYGHHNSSSPTWFSRAYSLDASGRLSASTDRAIYDLADTPAFPFQGFAAQIYWNGQLQETLYLKEVPHASEP